MTLPSHIKKRINKARDAKDADLYRLTQAQKLLDLFGAANGRPADTIEELDQWNASSEGVAANAKHRNENGTINPYSGVQ